MDTISDNTTGQKPMHEYDYEAELALRAEVERLTSELDTAKKYAEAYFDESELLKRENARLRKETERLP